MVTSTHAITMFYVNCERIKSYCISDSGGEYHIKTTVPLSWLWFLYSHFFQFSFINTVYNIIAQFTHKLFGRKAKKQAINQKS